MYEDKKDEYFEIDNKIRNSKRKLDNLIKNINVLENTDIDKLINELEEKQKKLNEINNILNNNVISKIDEHFEYKLKCIFKMKSSIINNTLTKEAISHFREELCLIEKQDTELFSLNELDYFHKTNTILDTEIKNTLKECEVYLENKKNSTPVKNVIENNLINDANMVSSQYSMYFKLNERYKYIVVKNVYSGSDRIGYIVLDKQRKSLFYISILAFYESNINNIEEIKQNININLPSSRRIFKDNITTLKDIPKIQLNDSTDFNTIRTIINSEFLECEKVSVNIKRILFNS